MPSTSQHPFLSFWKPLEALEQSVLPPSRLLWLWLSLRVSEGRIVDIVDEHVGAAPRETPEQPYHAAHSRWLSESGQLQRLCAVARRSVATSAAASTAAVWQAPAAGRHCCDLYAAAPD